MVLIYYSTLRVAFAVGAEFGLVDQNRPVPSLFGAEFVGPKQAGAEFVWCRHSWCRVGAEFARCRVCEVPSLLVPSLQGAEVSGTQQYTGNSNTNTKFRF